MLKDQKNSRKQGDVGLGAAIAYFTRHGVTTCLPLTDNQDYDLVIDDNGLKKVQIKTTYATNTSGNYNVSLRTNGGNRSRKTVKLFDNQSIDLLFILTEKNDMYLIPSSHIKAINSIVLCEKYRQYKLGD